MAQDERELLLKALRHSALALRNAKATSLDLARQAAIDAEIKRVKGGPIGRETESNQSQNQTGG